MTVTVTGAGEGAARGARLEGAAVLAATLAAHATGLGGAWQWDDYRVIVEEPAVASLAAWWRSMPGIRPLLKLTYAANQASGLGLAGFHAVNLAVHAAAALLALALLRRLAARADPGAAPDRAPLLAALLFALHPAQTEAVAYVSGRSTSLAAALALASALAFVAGRDGARPWLARLASPALLALSLGVKELAVALPAALVLLEAADRRRPFRWGAALRATAPHWAVLAVAGAAVAASPTYRALLGRSWTLRSPGANALTHLRALGWLCGQAARPWALAADPLLAPAEAWTWALAAGAALLVALAGAGAWLLRRRPPLGFGILWALLWLAPAGWVVPRPEPASDRQLYLALLGVAWPLAAALAGRAGAAAPAARRAVAAALVASLGALTAARGLVYADEVRFWSAAVARGPAPARAHANLGYALALACRPQEARAAFDRALALDPGDVRTAVNRRLLREGALLPEDAQRRCQAAGSAAPAEGRGRFLPGPHAE